MNRELIDLYYYYKTGKLGDLIITNRNEIEKDENYKKSINQLSMRHISVIELPSSIEYIVHKMICNKILDGKSGDELKLHYNEIFNKLRLIDIVEYNNKEFKDVNVTDEKSKDKTTVYEDIKKLKDSLLINASENQKKEEDKNRKLVKKVYKVDDYKNYIISIILGHSLDIIIELFPYETHGLPSLNLIMQVMNLLIDDKELIIEVEGLISCRIIDEYGLEDELIIESLIKKNDYLTRKMESAGLAIEDEMRKDNYFDTLDNIENVRNVIKQAKYLFLKYDPDFYIPLEQKKESVGKKDGIYIKVAEDLRKDIRNKISMWRKVNNEIYGIEVNEITFKDYINYIDNIVDYYKGKFHFDKKEIINKMKVLKKFTRIDINTDIKNIKK